MKGLIQSILCGIGKRFCERFTISCLSMVGSQCGGVYGLTPPPGQVVVGLVRGSLGSPAWWLAALERMENPPAGVWNPVVKI